MSVLTKSTLLKYYKRKDIQDAIIEHGRDKEIGVRYGDSFGKRPDTLTYPREIIELALKGVTSLHASEERWSNPLALDSSLTKKDLDGLRIGWDLLLDIDCKIFEYSRICAYLVVEFLKYCEVKDISIKFSGNKGFHIGVPFEAFPAKVGEIPTRLLFPEAAKKIALYVRDHIAGELARRIMILEDNNFNKVKEKVNLPAEEIIRYTQNQMGDKVAHLNVDKFLEIDTVLLSSRHLYRMPYSLHEKSGLASLPIDPEKILLFERKMGDPDLIRPQFVFMNRNVSGETARRLLVQALDYEVKLVEPREKIKEQKNYDELVINSPIKEDFFPPCMKVMLQGVGDGKKRAVFCMSGFLGKIGWNKEQIEEYLRTWNNEKNQPPLREVYLKGQLMHFNPGDKLPPNCNNDAYYKGIGVCKPDGLCGKIKNPVNYTLIRWKRYLQDREEEEEKGKRGKKKKESLEKKGERSNEKKEEVGERKKGGEEEMMVTKKVEEHHVDRVE